MTVDLGMSVKDAAASLGIPVKTIYALCECGKLPHRRIGPKGRGIRITEEHVRRYLAATEVTEANAPATIKEPPAPPRPKRPVMSRRPDGKPFRFIK